MRYRYLTAALLGLAACGPADVATTPPPARPPAPRPAARPATAAAPPAARPVGFRAITQDFDTWYRYAYYQVRLSRAFNGEDTNGRPLSKQAFLTRLATGKVLALRRDARRGPPTYYLHAYASPGRNEDIWTTSRQMAEEELNNCRREGQPLPAFKFVDLNGVTYTPASTRGKVLVLKCWYIGCVACVNEFPALNKLADRYQQHPDVLFVSLATDKADKLQVFLKEHEWRFATVPDCWPYMSGTLELPAYPTHFVVGRDGKVLRVTHQADDLAAALASAVPLAAR